MKESFPENFREFSAGVLYTSVQHGEILQMARIITNSTQNSQLLVAITAQVVNDVMEFTDKIRTGVQ